MGPAAPEGRVLKVGWIGNPSSVGPVRIPGDQSKPGNGPGKYHGGSCPVDPRTDDHGAGAAVVHFAAKVEVGELIVCKMPYLP
jgi:hypothetical protein